jgi:hypothetical protein
MQDLRLPSIVGMFLVIDLSAWQAVIAASPGTQVDQVAALAAERTELIALRHVRRLFADWTPHTFETCQIDAARATRPLLINHGFKLMPFMSLHGAGWKSLEQDTIFGDLDALDGVAFEVGITERSVQPGTSIEAGLQSFAFGQVELRDFALLCGSFLGRRSARASAKAGERSGHGNCA